MQDEQVRTAAATALGKIGSHSQKCITSIIASGCLSKLVSFYDATNSEENRKQTKLALKTIFKECRDVETFIPILEDANTSPKAMKVNCT